MEQEKGLQETEEHENSSTSQGDVGVTKRIPPSDNSMDRADNKQSEQRISTGSIRLSASALTPSAVKRPKSDMWQAALEVGIAGISLAPPISPRPVSPPTTPTPERGFFSKLTSLFTSSSTVTTPTPTATLQSNFHKEIDTLLPPPLPPSKVATHLAKIIFEIITTEWEYLGDLLALSDIQVMMLANEILEQADAMRIFSNIDQILMANIELYRTFQKKEWNCKESIELADLDSLATNIADGFVAMAAYLRMYANYSSKHEDSLKAISTLSEQSDFSDFLLQIKKEPVCKNLALPGLLIKPIQRVCKYPLLLRELLKYVDNPATQPKIEKAGAKIEETLLKVNEHQKVADRVDKTAKVLQELLDGGIDLGSLGWTTVSFICQGTLRSIENGKTKEGHYYLFTDLFLWTRKILSTIKLVAKIPLKESVILDIDPPIPDAEHGFELVHVGQKKWQFFLDKPEEIAPLKKILAETIELAYQSK